MTFNFVQQQSKAKLVFLLQPDNFESYELLVGFQDYLELLKNSMQFKVHYKVFRNMSLDDEGNPSDADPASVSNVIFIDDDYYFVTKNNSFEKSRSLFFESLKQMCLYFASELIFFNYIKEVRLKCFEGPDPMGNFNAVSHFMECTQGIYGSDIKGKDPKFDTVRVIRK